jgi:NADH:ubiquinone oxidoreductase subunit K
MEHGIELRYFLLCIGFLGLLLNRSNIIIVLLSMEFILLSSALSFLSSSLILDDFFGIHSTLFLFTIGAAETSIGLSLLVYLYKTP